MGKKDKPKKISAKKEKYLKFRKEKTTTMDWTPPALTDEQVKQKQEDEMKISKFMRFSRNPPPTEVVERKMRSKR
ncbi:hypothetical protein JXA85_02080 [Candidatus Woesearchaeota archaeon]|nr:hypothetical protein [Candidatus Woesearchaeota archaeon]